eukprot:3632817-Pleurochrysis_carterae.AAC.2
MILVIYFLSFALRVNNKQGTEQQEQGAGRPRDGQSDSKWQGRPHQGKCEESVQKAEMDLVESWSTSKQETQYTGPWRDKTSITSSERRRGHIVNVDYNLPCN